MSSTHINLFKNWENQMSSTHIHPFKKLGKSDEFYTHSPVQKLSPLIETVLLDTKKQMLKLM